MQPKNKPLKRRKYDATFNVDVLKMIDKGQIVPEVSQALDISEALVYNRWYRREKEVCIRIFFNISDSSKGQFCYPKLILYSPANRDYFFSLRSKSYHINIT